MTLDNLQPSISPTSFGNDNRIYIPFTGFHALSTYLSWLMDEFGNFIVLLVSSFSGLFQTKQHCTVPSQPPRLQPKVPFIGHLLRLVVEGTEYLRALHRTTGLPIFTLPIAGRSYHVVASPHMVHAVQKDYKVFSFNAIIVDVARRIFLFDKEAMAAFEGTNQSITRNEKRKPSALQMARGQFVKNLRPGFELDDLLLRFTDGVLVDVHAHLKSPSDGNVTHLWKRIRTDFSTAVARAFWGARHPFCHNSAVYWAAMEDFEAGALNLFALPLPFLTARKANSARSKLLQALKDYTERDGFQDSASFIKCQYEACHDLGTSIMSNGGLGLAFSAIGPITSTAFWMVCYIFSRPDLLAEVRAEVDSCLNVDEGRSHGQSIRSCTIDTAALNRHCPTLFMCLVEILRLSSTQPTFRIVQEDTTLKDPASGVSYELKKNDVITLISAGMLDASELWGSDHEDFRPARFDDAASQHIPKKFDVTQPYWMSQAQRAAFVPRGSGVHMCAGCFFAQEAILAYTALYVSAYDITDLQGKPLRAPSMSRKLSVSNAKPASDVEVCLRPRQRVENFRYKYKVAQRT
ncbi:hypothetical protein D0861_05423 [Hortaea werneckii]|uniref:Cytochrome P450 n=1 Tax=Hortaea werneckii TaxID=91943 RepID=A0A3M7FES7_HORWE|nr:hypothetical protein D0861_05423 [Hortaea werneckii]